MDETRIELLNANHERAAFDCGKSSLNSFIRQHAAINHERGVSRVYVAVRGSRNEVIAYFAASAGSFLRDHLPADDRTGLPRYPLPTAHLGRLAVDLTCRGQRLGERLLFRFLKTACDVADQIGIFAVDLFAKDDEAKGFYLKYGFIHLQDEPFHLYLPITTVQAMFTKSISIVPTPKKVAVAAGNSLSWDFSKEMISSLANLDQRLVTFKKYYSALDTEEREAFGRWIRSVSEAIPLDFDQLFSLMTTIGCGNSQWIHAEIEVSVGPVEKRTETARIPPQILRVAVEAWEKDEDFVPPMTWDYT